MLEINCKCCGKELTQMGALLFGCPRIADGSVSKVHLCGQCFTAIMDFIRAWPKQVLE